jgi:uncharacterized BrkB/YihY/UPF0761 family membrane protein
VEPRGWAAAARSRAEQLAARAQAERRRHSSVDAAFDMVDRDADVAGGIIAGALAYRLFIWLLPFALVLVAGLGLAADSASRSPEDTAEAIGLEGLITRSITSAAESPNRWYALAIGIPVLLYATSSLLRVLIGAHRLAWTDDRSAVPKPTPGATVVLLVVLLAFVTVSGFASSIRAWSEPLGVLSTAAVALPYAGLWLLESNRLPHRGVAWTALLPGAILFGVGLELLHVVTAYVIEPWAVAKQGTYGALGVAAALLFGLFLLSRLIVAAAIVNATLWERSLRRR